MTPARKAALQWFHDRGEVKLKADQEGRPTNRMILAMQIAGQLTWLGDKGGPMWSLTDKGRRMLHGDDA